MRFTAGPIASSVGSLAGSPGAGGSDGPNWTAGLHAPRSVDGTTPEVTPPAAGGGYASAYPDDFRELESWGLVERPMAAVEEGTRDPLDIWPMNLHRVLFAAATDPTPPAERY